MTSINCLSVKQTGEWQEILEESFEYDWYHLADTHTLAERNGEGTGHLFVFREGPYLIAMPLLLRSLEAVPELGAAGSGWNDATSVYGYAGPVASHQCMPEPVVARFQAALSGTLREMRVVSIFSRLHPLIPQRHLLEGLGETIPMGQTVSIDLTLPSEVQYKQFHKCHRQDIRRAKELGLICMEDKAGDYFNELIELYAENMRRLHAAPYYFFDRAYFEALFHLRGCSTRLFVVLHGEEVIHVSVVVACRKFVHGHLTSTKGSALKLAPMKLCTDAVRLWSIAEGFKVMHMGGGLGGRADSLFQFKAGFSRQRHEFYTWRYVIEPGVYRELCEAKARNAAENGLTLGGYYFPTYRAPALASEAVNLE